jgi:hypothetical protein
MIEENLCPPPLPITQLLYVLPYSDFKDFIPEVYKPIEKKIPTLCSMNFPIHYEFCKFFWEGHADFHYIPLKQLNQEVINVDAGCPSHD